MMLFLLIWTISLTLQAPARTVLSLYQEDPIDEYSVLQSIIIDAQERGDGFLTQEWQTIEDLAISQTQASYRAQAILAVESESYAEYQPTFPDYAKKSAAPERRRFKKKVVQADWLKLYPNPSDREVFVELSSDLGGFDSGEIMLYDQRGIPLRVVYLQQDNHQYLLDISALPMGLYTLHIRADEVPLGTYSIIKK